MIAIPVYLFAAMMTEYVSLKLTHEPHTHVFYLLFIVHPPFMIIIFNLIVWMTPLKKQPSLHSSTWGGRCHQMFLESL